MVCSHLWLLGFSLDRRVSTSSPASMARQKEVKNSALKSKAQKKAIAQLPKAAVAKAQGSSSSKGARCNSTIVTKGELKKTRSLDEEVKRAIQLRFVGIDEASMFGNIVEGMTLFDAVKAKKVQVALRGGYLDDAMWDDMVAKYKIKVVVPVSVRDKNETVDPTLVSSLAACKTNERCEG